MKKILTLALAASLALTPVAFAEEEDGSDIKVYLDGQRIEFADADGETVYPVVIDGVTYLPVRSLAEGLDLSVTWNSGTRSIHLSSGGNQVIASDFSAFANLGRYLDSPYDILGTSSFLNPLKELLGGDYDTLLLPTLSTCYATGDSEMITLHCEAENQTRSVIDVYKDGRIDAAIAVSEVENDDDNKTTYRNVVKYYSSELPDAVDSPGVIKFIADNAATHGIIEFCHGSGTPRINASTYTDVNGYGSMTFTPTDDGVSFSGSIDGPNGDCSTRGTMTLSYGCAVCYENGAPSIVFAFSGDSLTVIGLNNVTKALTTVYKK